MQSPIGSQFASDVGFTAAQFAQPDNAVYKRVRDHIIEQTGTLPHNVAYANYDSVWILGLTILDVGTLDPLRIEQELPRVVTEYTDGAMGKIRLTEAGDLVLSDYEIWQVKDKSWRLFGLYDATEDRIDVN